MCNKKCHKIKGNEPIVANIDFELLALKDNKLCMFFIIWQIKEKL